MHFLDILTNLLFLQLVSDGHLKIPRIELFIAFHIIECIGRSFRLVEFLNEQAFKSVAELFALAGRDGISGEL